MFSLETTIPFSTTLQYADNDKFGASAGLSTPMSQFRSSVRGQDQEQSRQTRDGAPLTSTPTIGSNNNGDQRPFQFQNSDSAYTREYSYTVQQNEKNAQFSPKQLGAFSYAPAGSKESESSLLSGPTEPGAVESKRATARAFTYKPAEASSPPKPLTSIPPTSTKTFVQTGKESSAASSKENRHPFSSSLSETQVDHVKTGKTDQRQFAQLIQTGKEQRDELRREQHAKESKPIDRMNALFGSSKSTKKTESESKSSSLFSGFGRRTEPQQQQQPTTVASAEKKRSSAYEVGSKHKLESDSDSESQKSSENSMDEYASEDINARPVYTGSSVIPPRTSSYGLGNALKSTSTHTSSSVSNKQSPAPNVTSFTTTNVTSQAADRTTTGGSTPASRTKESILQKELTISKQVTESSKMITGKLEDIYPLIKNEAVKYGHPADQELPLPNKSLPVITSETRKSQYSSQSGSWQQNLTQQQKQSTNKPTSVGSGISTTSTTTTPTPSPGASAFSGNKAASPPKPQPAPRPSAEALRRAGSPSVFNTSAASPKPGNRETRPTSPTSPTSSSNPIEANKAAKRRFLTSGPGTVPGSSSISEKITESSVSNKTKTVETVTVG